MPTINTSSSSDYSPRSHATSAGEEGGGDEHGARGAGEGGEGGEEEASKDELFPHGGGE